MKRRIDWDYIKNPLDRTLEPHGEGGEDFSDLGNFSGFGDEASPFSSPNNLLLPIGVFYSNLYIQVLKGATVYLANATWRITQEEINGVALVEGVDGVNPVSPHSFHIIVAKAFINEDSSGGQVLRNVENHLNAPREQVDEREEIMRASKPIVAKIRQEARRNDHYFAAMIFPNGKVDYIQSNIKEEVIRQYDIYMETSKAVGGEIYYDVG